MTLFLHMAGANFVDSVAEFTPSGTTVNGALISGLNWAGGLAISGNDIFVGSENTVGEYTLSGTAVNATLLNFLLPDEPISIAISGNDMYVGYNNSANIAEYTTSGTIVNNSLITGLFGLDDIQIYGGNLYAAHGGTLSEYTLSGAPVNTALLSGLNTIEGFAIVPEPSTWVMLAIGFAAMLAYGIRKQYFLAS